MTTALKQVLEALEIGAEWTSEYVSQMSAYAISERAAAGLAIIQAAITAAEAELSREQPARVGLTEARILEIRDSLLPSQGEPFDCVAFAVEIVKAERARERAHNIPAAQEGK